jgi:hypothetical protein
MYQLRELIRKIRKYLTACFLLPVYAVQCLQTLQAMQKQLLALSGLVGYMPEACYGYSPARRKKSAIMTVLIVKENILFLEEWISHHLAIGVDHIVLYDNSQSHYDDTFGKPLPGVEFEGNRINKHNVDYDRLVAARLSPEQMKNQFEQLKEKYSQHLTVIKWANHDRDGKICYFQARAIKDFVWRFRSQFDYGLAIDTDEFLVSDDGIRIPDLIDHMETNNIGAGHLSQRRFLYRFASMDTQVREIPYCLKEDLLIPETSACKTIFRLHLYQHFHDPLVVHYIPTVLNTVNIDPMMMRFHHYGWPSVRGKHSLKDLDAGERQFLKDRFAEDRSAFKYLTPDSTDGLAGVSQAAG